jgi:hypothetical protein
MATFRGELGVSQLDGLPGLSLAYPSIYNLRYNVRSQVCTQVHRSCVYPSPPADRYFRSGPENMTVYCVRPWLDCAAAQVVSRTAIREPPAGRSFDRPHPPHPSRNPTFLSGFTCALMCLKPPLPHSSIAQLPRSSRLQSMHRV